MRKAQPIRERFDKYVIKTDGCWIWSGSQRKGYGKFRVGERTLSAHRVAYVLENHILKDGDVVHHTCANSLCVRPDHLQVTDQHSNLAEMLERQSYLKAIAKLTTEVKQLQKELRKAKKNGN
jgi:hypothetical protein